MTVTLGAGYGYPVSASTVNITGLLNNNTPLFANPTTSLNSSVTTLNTNTQTSVNGFISSDMTGNMQILSNNMTSLNGALSGFQTHTDGLITNMPANMSLSDASIQLGQTLSPTSIGSVCSAMNNFFGSILGAGLALLQQVQALLQQIASLIAQGLAAILAVISSIIASISSLVSQLLNIVSAEVAALAAALAQLLNFSIASLIANLLPTSCQQLIISGVGTAALAGAL